MIDTIKQLKDSATQEAKKNAALYAQKWGMKQAYDLADSHDAMANVNPTTYRSAYAKAFRDQLDAMEVEE